MLVTQIGRAELKYYVSKDKMGDLRQAILNHCEPDQFAARMEDYTYRVRSIYFDSSDFRFYYDKLDGLEIRKKLRLRAYDRYEEEGTGFLEIKRRRSNRIIKERAPVSLAGINDTLSKLRLPDSSEDYLPAYKNVVNKFLAIMVSLELQPTALILYDRQAFTGLIDPTERVTIDMNVRSSIFPSLEDLFREDDLAPVVADRHILELKFNRFMPKWMNRLVADFQLRCQSIPKYCMGVEQFDLDEIRGGRRPAYARRA